MKSKIKDLLEMLRELIPENGSNRQTYNNMRLIPVPVKARDQKRPNPYNSNR